MSHLSRHRNKLIAGAVIATAGGLSAVSQASPLVQLVMLGKDISTGQSTFTANQTVFQNDTVVYEVLAFLAATGTTNSSIGGHTITAKVNNTDGINSLGFDAYQLSTDAIQVDFKNAIVKGSITTSSPTASQGMALNGGNGANNNTNTQAWNSVTGATGGVLGHQSTANLPNARTGPNNDIIKIRPGFGPGIFKSVSSTQQAAVVGTGLFTVASVGGSSATVKLRYTPISGGQGGSGGGFQINGGTDTNNILDSEEAGSDPFMGFTPLTITAVPEPGSLSLLGLAAAGLLARRKNKKA